MTNAALTPGIKDYNSVKEAIEAKKEQDRKEESQRRQVAKLKAQGEELKARAARVAEYTARAAKTKSMQAQIPKTPTKPKTSKPVEKGRKNNPFVVDSDSESDEDAEMEDLVIEDPATTLFTTPENNKQAHSSGSEDVSSQGSTKARSPSVSPTKARRKTAITKTRSPRKGSDDARKAAQKKRRDDQAREKEQERLLAEAEKRGTTYTHGELERTLESFMDSREVCITPPFPLFVEFANE